METLAVWLPSLIISLVAVGAFLYLAYQSRIQIDKLRKTLRQTSDQLVEQFLQRESDHTLRYIQHAADNATGAARWLPEMRRCWLDAELAALVDRGHNKSDYASLQRNAAPLLRIVQRAAAAPVEKKNWNSTETRQYLRKTRDAVASQKQFIEEFKARTATMGKKTKPGAAASNPEERSSSHADSRGFIESMEHMESSTAELLRTIERLEHELAAAQDKYDIIQDKLTALEAIRATRTASVQITERLSTDRSAGRADNDLLLDMESAYTNSLAEMKKMSDINRQQRQLILQMEKELLLLKKDSVEQQSASAVLDKLKLQLRDYENCTAILEMESETLREQIQSLRHAIDVSGNADTTTGAAESLHPLDPMLATKPAPAPAAEPARPQGNPLELLERIAQAEGLDQAAAGIVAWLDQQGIASVIFLKGSREQIWTASEGRVDDHSRQLLKSMVPVAGKPISEVREGIMFIYSMCRILLQGKGEFHERASQAKAALRDSFAAADSALQLLQDRLELRQQHQQMEKIQQKIRSLLVQYNYVDSEYTRTQTDFRKELGASLATSAITEVQRQCIDTMLEDFDSQLEILSRTGKLIGNGLKASIQELSRVEQSHAG